MKQQEGLVDAKRSNFVCKLGMTLSSLNQASKGLYMALCSTPPRCELDQLGTDPAVFVSCTQLTLGSCHMSMIF